MSEQAEDATATEDAAPTTAELAGRVDALDSKLDMILDKISGTTSTAHDAAQQHTEDRLDRPSTIADEIRQQLAQRDAEAAAAAEKQGVTAKLADLEAKVTGMGEHRPGAPVRRVEKLWGWR